MLPFVLGSARCVVSAVCTLLLNQPAPAPGCVSLLVWLGRLPATTGRRPLIRQMSTLLLLKTDHQDGGDGLFALLLQQLPQVRLRRGPALAGMCLAAFDSNVAVDLRSTPPLFCSPFWFVLLTVLVCVFWPRHGTPWLLHTALTALLLRLACCSTQRSKIPFAFRSIVQVDVALTSGGGALSALQAFRLFRAFKLLQ